MVVVVEVMVEVVVVVEEEVEEVKRNMSNIDQRMVL